jgi:hypothetical protein
MNENEIGKAVVEFGCAASLTFSLGEMTGEPVR